MFRIIYALEQGNTLTYLFLSMLLYPLVMMIIFIITDKFQRR